MFQPSRSRLDVFQTTQPRLPMFRLCSTEEEQFDQVRLRTNVLTELDRTKNNLNVFDGFVVASKKLIYFRTMCRPSRCGLVYDQQICCSS